MKLLYTKLLDTFKDEHCHFLKEVIVGQFLYFTCFAKHDLPFLRLAYSLNQYSSSLTLCKWWSRWCYICTYFTKRLEQHFQQ